MTTNQHNAAGRKRYLFHILALLGLSIGTSDVAAFGPMASSIELLPARVELSGPAARQRLLVQHRHGDHLGAAVAEDQIAWQTSDPEVARIEGATVVPVGDGQATITVHVGSATATAEVVVRDFAQPVAWSFRNHVQSIFSKAGCNSGACHGALAGKGGFKLSLRGYDTTRDYQTITRQARGRRIELSDPGRSLILAKPSGALPHKGGLRYEADSEEYRVVADWIASGAAAPQTDDPRLEQLEFLPPASVQQVGGHQPLVVRAHFSDGRIEDVTRWCKFSSTNETVARVDESGRVEIIGHGEGAITAWYLSRIVMARLTSPFPHDVAEADYDQSPPANFIDELVLQKLVDLNLRPSPPADDATFLRRAFLDTIGRLPTIEETRAFLSDDSLDKRNRLIDNLLARTEFVDYWTYKWSDLLLVNGKRLRPKALEAYYQWIREAVAANLPWDELARQIVTASGTSYENGATNFYALHQDPQEMSENVSVAFLGLNINCARCHNHPLEKWTNDQYYAMANLFARVRAKGWGGDPRSGDGLRTLYVVDRGELVQPLTGRPQPPTPLDGEPLPMESSEDRREHLARWLTSRDNPYFSRAVANRVWANFFGVGLVEPVDDLRVSNPASNEQLLSACADYLEEHDFDLKQLMRAILQSSTYQRSSQPLPENIDERRFYSRYYPKRLMAEVLLDAISQVTDVPTKFTLTELTDESTEKTDLYPTGTRAIQLHDSAVVSDFLETFGRNERMIACECERTDTPSMVQVLHISNGDTINGKLQASGNRLDDMLNRKLDHSQLVEEAYLLALSRYPTDDERRDLVALLDASDASERRLYLEDLFWSLLSSREFLFNH